MLSRFCKLGTSPSSARSRLKRLKRRLLRRTSLYRSGIGQEADEPGGLLREADLTEEDFQALMVALTPQEHGQLLAAVLDVATRYDEISDPDVARFLREEDVISLLRHQYLLVFGSGIA